MDTPSQKKVTIEEASTEALRNFAEAHLGLAIHANTARKNIVAKISEAWDNDYILVMEEQQGSHVQETKRAPEGVKPDQYRILIPKTEDPGGDEPVPVGVNGKVMLVPRGKPVDVPKAYYEVLRNAVRHVYDSLPDGGINPEPRKINDYHMQLIATP